MRMFGSSVCFVWIVFCDKGPAFGAGTGGICGARSEEQRVLVDMEKRQPTGACKMT